MFAWTTMYFSPPERTKTGKFLEEFAQDADGCKVSSILQLPCYEHPPAPTTTKQSNIFRSRRGNSSRDEENPEEKGKSTKPKRDWIPERPIRLSYYRLRYPGAEEMILGIDDLPPDGAKNDTRSEGAKDLHWIEIRGWERGYMDLDPFRRFVKKATEHSYIPEQNRADISKWLESLDNDYSQEAFPGTRLPPMIKGFVSNSRSEGDNMRQLSCLFFCFPYFQLSIQGHFELSTIQKHSIRPLVQSFYRSKSPFDRELDQAARKFLKNDSKIIYVPQFWGLLINDDYLATYSPSQLHLRHGSRILTAPSSKFPSSFRLLLPKGPSFYVYWADCPTWFDFLSRVHSICSQVLENHVDPEQNAYRSVEQAEIIDANNWSKKAAEEREKIFEIEILDEFAQFRELLDGNQSRRRVRRTRAHSAVRDSRVRDYDQDLRRERYYNRDYSPEPELQENYYSRNSIEPRRPRKHYQYSAPRGDYEPDANYDYPLPHYIDQKVRYYHLAKRGTEPSIPKRTLCGWPGCYDSGENDSENESTTDEDAINSLFWTPSDSPDTDRIKVRMDDTAPLSMSPSEAAENMSTNLNTIPYLCWELRWPDPKTDTNNIASYGQPSSSNELVHPQDSRVQSSARAQRPTALEQVTISIDKQLNDEITYVQQVGKETKDVDELLKALPTTIPHYGKPLGEMVKELVGHFIETGVDCELEKKLWGALHGILTECSYPFLSNEAHRIVLQVADYVEEMQETSSSIITGTRGRSHRGRALSSLVEAFQHLVWGLCLLNAYLKAENERPEQSETSEFDIEEMESTPWQDSSVGNAERDIFNPLTIEEEDDDQLGGASDGENSDNDQPDGVSDGENSDDDNLGGASDGENLDDDNSGLPDRGGGLGGYIYDVQDTANDKAPTRNIDTGNKAVSIFEEAKTQLSLAKKHIIQLLARENWKELSEYVTVGSGDLVISALEFLARGDTDGYRLEDIYRERCSELRLLVRDTSRRGLLNDLDQVEEEMDSIVYTICQQIQVLDQLSPIYSKRMPKLMAVIDSTKRALEEKLGVYDDLKIRTRAMARQVIRQLEIKQDSNNKAITIFTIVTVLFLPLSFVTSYLGMNTADIRETNSKQGLFWSIAIPLTTVFAGIAMTIAYRQPLKGWVVRHVTKRKFRDRIRDFDY